MPLGKMNMLGNQQAQIMPQQNQGFQAPNVPVHYNRTPLLGRGLQRYVPRLGVQGGLIMPPGYAQPMNNFGGGQGVGMPRGMIGGNSAWGSDPQSFSRQGYAAPGYPPQGFQQLQQPVPTSQGYPFQGYNQGFGGQTPIQPAWEEPKKGGIKGFIGNFMAKMKR